MTDGRQRVGRRGEELAKRHLEASGYSILEANYRGKAGEIDLVAEKDGVLVFVEVRARTGAAFGSPEESITPQKRSHIVDTALEYLQANGAESREWRVDLVAIELEAGARLKRLDVLENAVEL
jgi:putative endonuclease